MYNNSKNSRYWSCLRINKKQTKYVHGYRSGLSQYLKHVNNKHVWNFDIVHTYREWKRINRKISLYVRVMIMFVLQLPSYRTLIELPHSLHWKRNLVYGRPKKIFWRSFQRRYLFYWISIIISGLLLCKHSTKNHWQYIFLYSGKNKCWRFFDVILSNKNFKSLTLNPLIGYNLFWNLHLFSVT